MINIPFNFDPVSIATYTNTYTIPAGFYAVVEAQCEKQGRFQIAGSTALIGEFFSEEPFEQINARYVMGTDTSQVLATAKASGKTKVFARNNASAALGAALDIDGQIIHPQMNEDEIIEVDLVDGAVLTATTQSGVGSNISVWGYHERRANDAEPTKGTFYVPTGTLLDVDNGHFTVMLFNKIGS